MPVDVFLDPYAREFVDGLTLTEQLQVRAATDHLMVSAEPDGISKIRLPFPFRFGTISYVSGGFFFTYEFENAITVRILSISREVPTTTADLFRLPPPVRADSILRAL